MDYEKLYKESLERAKKLHKDAITLQLEQDIKDYEYIFPELRQNEDEKIRSAIIDHLKDSNLIEWAAWLEKQGNTNETINRDEFAQGVLRGAAVNLITWIDYNAAEGNMCLSNMECEDIEDALVNGNWNKIYAYIRKKLEKQGEQKPINDTDEKIVEAVKDTSVLDTIEPKFKVGDWVVDKQGIIHQVANVVENITYHTYGYDIVDGGYFNDNTEGVRLWTIQDAKDGDVLYSSTHHLIWLYKDNEHYHAAINLNYADTVSFDNEIVVPSDVCPASRVQKSILFQKMKEAGYEWDVEKKGLKKIHNALEECEIENIEHGKYYYCIKDYFCGGRKQASKGDVVQALRGMSMMALGVKANEYFLPVNSIKQKTDWSEEDDSKIESICRLLKTRFDKDTCDEVGFTRDKMCDYLIGIKNKIRPQWKPSEEQLEKLHYAMQNFGGETFKVLNSLYEQLKKL